MKYFTGIDVSLRAPGGNGIGTIVSNSQKVRCSAVGRSITVIARNVECRIFRSHPWRLEASCIHDPTAEIDALSARPGWNQGLPARVAAQVGRPKWWCYRRALALELSQPARNQPVFSKQEDELAALAHLGPASVSRKPAAAGYRRSQTAIKVWLKCLGTSRRQARLDEGLMTATQLASVVGVDAKTVLR